ncbi:TROVE domain-containing protein [Lewinella cohaerens]|uniref:TROVE domain-containing protein n=1 Tax=Lewinella cohaerens TaxID=70995 RepID=UPI00036AE49B|nr:TROVE domain-containing protein [Lewinella cohaerens]
MKFNKRKTRSPFSTGIIAGKTTAAAGRYTPEQALRRVTMANLLWESTYYQSADTIMTRIEELIPQVKPEVIAQLALETRFEQRLRHTPLYLALQLFKHHGSAGVADVLAKICTRPDMTMDTLAMLPRVLGRKSLKPIPKCIKKGLAQAFDQYDAYQIAKYKRAKHDLSLVDVVNLVHPIPTQTNATALQDLVKNQLTAADTWESNLSAGEDKAVTFTRLLEEGKLGALALLRNLRGMTEAGVSRQVITRALTKANSKWLTPLNFLAAQRYAPQFSAQLEDMMARSFATRKIAGTTILAVDVSGSMGSLTSGGSKFSRMDLAFALAALAGYMFEDLMLVFTAGSDYRREGAHVLWSNSKGFGIFNDQRAINAKVGGGGIFTHQLCEWLKEEGLADQADRLVVISDSQDIDASSGKKVLADTSPYKTSYIIDISTHTHGIKTGHWTAEINGWSDRLFHYIAEVEQA